MGQVSEQEHKAIAAISTVAFAKRHNQKLIVCAPDVQHGWFCAPCIVVEQMTAEVHFKLDADDDFEEIEVWVNGNDLWMVLSDEYQKDVLGQLHERLPALLLQRDREIEEERVGL